MRVLSRLADVLAVFAGLLVLAIMLGISADVGARYFFNQPFVWMFEAVQYALLAVLFLGSPWVTRNNGHVAVDLLLDIFRPATRRRLQSLAFLIAALISVFLSWWAAVVTFDNWSRTVLTTGIYPVPRHYLIALITIGLFLTGIEFLGLSRRAWRGELAAPSVDPSTAV